MENNSTLERLLRIQGTPKQITLEAVMEDTRVSATVPPDVKHQQSEQHGNGSWKISPAEREAWSSLYRIYEKYVPMLRAAAHLDDDNAEAARVFQSAAEEMNEIYQERGLIGKTLSIPLFDLLNMVFNEARE